MCKKDQITNCSTCIRSRKQFSPLLRGHSKSRNGKWEMRNGKGEIGIEEVGKWNGNAQVVSQCKGHVVQSSQSHELEKQEE